jgi:hypothetical protein
MLRRYIVPFGVGVVVAFLVAVIVFTATEDCALPTPGGRGCMAWLLE